MHGPFSCAGRSGTGLLSIALSPLVAHYAATDIQDLLPLIRKNLVLNFPGWPHVPSKQGIGHNISVEELDWETLHSTPPSRRAQLFPPPSAPWDLVLIVDCIYHPALLPSLLATIDYIATSVLTTVVVAVELRAEDVIRDFLEQWLSLGGGEWEVWRVGNDKVTEGILAIDKPYVMWVGWKGVGVQ